MKISGSDFCWSVDGSFSGRHDSVGLRSETSMGRRIGWGNHQRRPSGHLDFWLIGERVSI